MSEQNLLLDRQGYVARITFNRPESLNALDAAVKTDLATCLAELNQDINTRVIILRGAGRAFSSGGDLLSMGEYAPGQGRARALLGQEILQQILRSDKPIIASIHGYAAGAGFSLACACDFRIAGDNAKFLAPFANIGLVPGFGLMYTLPRLVGLSAAREIVMLAEPFDAVRAQEFGLLNRLVPIEELEAATWAFAAKLAGKAPPALALTKNIMNSAWDLDLASMLQQEALAQDLCMGTPEHNQAVAEFKRKKAAKQDSKV